MKKHLILPALAFCLLLLPAPARAGGDFPALVIPETAGMQLRGNYSDDANLDKMVALGVKNVRMGFHWEGIEKEKGVYDFANLDAIMARVRAHGLRMTGVLAFGNKLYGAVYNTDDGRQGYAAYAAACAAHFKNDRIMWEIWNEPNTFTFWGRHGKASNSEPFAEEYLNLVKVTVPAMRKADPECTILGGSTSNLWSASYAWCDFCFQKGALKTGIDAWSIHPYGVNVPEEYPRAYGVVRDKMARYGSPNFPILDTERGFGTSAKAEGFAGGAASPQRTYQAWNLVRQFLMEFTYGVRLSSWYEWQNEKEGFGICQPDGTLYPAGVAYQVVLAQLYGCKFDKRLPTANPLDYVMHFNGNGDKIAAWTSQPLPDPELNKIDKGRSAPDKAIPHSITIPVAATGPLKLVQIDGTATTVTPVTGQVTLNLTGGPQYLTLKEGTQPPAGKK